jgi:phosphatidylglycerophosphate synthase
MTDFSSTSPTTAARHLEVERCRARGHKIPSHLEHPLTTSILLPLCDMVVDALYVRGIVPNHVTALSFVVRMTSIGIVFFSGASWTTVALFAFGYWLDCLDGVLARRHNLVTSLGDMLEHINDVTTTLLLCAVLACCYSIHWVWILAFLGTFLGTCIHMGLVETYNCDINHQGNEANFLFALTHVSRFLEPIRHPLSRSRASSLSGDNDDDDGQSKALTKPPPLPAYNLPRFEHDMLWLMNHTRHATDVTVILVLTAFMAWQVVFAA